MKRTNVAMEEFSSVLLCKRYVKDGGVMKNSHVIKNNHFNDGTLIETGS